MSLNGDEIAYTISEDEWHDLDGESSFDVEFTLVGTPKYSGTYSDTLTFTATFTPKE